MSQAGFKAGRVARDGERAVDALRALYGKRKTPESREAAKAAELQDFARGYGAPLKISASRQNAGELVFDRDDPRGNAGSAMWHRLWAAVWAWLGAE